MRKLIFAPLIFLWSLSKGQTDIQTGNAVYQVPIFEHTDTKTGLGTGISISYNSNGGIQANQVSSEIGIGWTFNAGGSIQRIKKGEPDDQYQLNSFPGQSDASQIYERDNSHGFENYYANGYLFNTFPVDDLPVENALMPRFPQSGSASYLQSPRASADKEQDIFILQVGSSTVRFVLMPDASKFAVLGDTKIQVDYTYFDNSYMTSNNLQTRIKSFVVTDDKGLKYYFEDFDLEGIGDFEQENSVSASWIQFSVSRMKVTPKRVINTWRLSYIQNPFNSKKIEFIYGSRNYDYINMVYPSYTEYVPDNQTSAQVNVLSVYKTRSFGTRKILVRIKYPDGMQVDIDNDPDARYDINDGSGRVIKVTAKNAEGKEVHKVYFNESFMYKGQLRTNMLSDNTYNNQKCMKMCLTGLNINNKLLYDFEYILAIPYGEPGYNSLISLNSIIQDAWGYHSINSNINDDIDSYSNNDIANLKGYLTTSAATNRQPVTGLAKLGLLKKITLPTAGTIEFEYEQNKAYYNNADVETGGVRVKKVTQSDNVSGGALVVTQYAYTSANSNSSGWGYEALNTYSIKDLMHRRDVPLPGGGSFARGGVLAKKTEFQVLKMFWSLTKQGIGYAIPVYGQVAFIVETTINYVTFLVDPIADYNVKQWDFFCDFRNNPLGINYSRVEVVNLPSGNGKTVHEFTVPAPGDILPNTAPFSSKQRIEDWKYGLPLKTTLFDNSGNPVKSSENTYSSGNTTLTTKNAKYDPVRFFSNRYDHPVYNGNAINATYFAGDVYYLKQGKANLVQSKEKTYGSNGRIKEVNTFYDYTGTVNNQPREMYTYNSKGEKTGKTIYYSSDYSITTGAMGLLKANNMLSIPVAELSWYIPVGTTSKMFTGITITEFSIVAGEPKVYKTYTAFNAAPVPASQVGAFDPGNIMISYPNLRAVTLDNYDVSGNTVGTTQLEGSQKQSFVYDFDGRTAIAQVSNANASDIAYTSFETAELGNWTVNTPVYTSNSLSPTGRRYLEYEENVTIISKTGLNASQTYTVTYWSNNGSLALNGTSNGSNLVTINGWTLYRHTFTGLTSFQMLPSPFTGGHGNIGIDELRLHPSNARMATAVFEQGIGKTAKADENNRITYYTYDALNRLILVQDQHRNAVRSYDYNNVNSPH